jgi:hypothetical protein
MLLSVYVLRLGNNHDTRDILSNDDRIVSDFDTMIIKIIVAYICLLPLSNSSVSKIFG